MRTLGLKGKKNNKEADWTLGVRGELLFECMFIMTFCNFLVSTKARFRLGSFESEGFMPFSSWLPDARAFSATVLID